MLVTIVEKSPSQVPVMLLRLCSELSGGSDSFTMQVTVPVEACKPYPVASMFSDLIS